MQEYAFSQWHDQENSSGQNQLRIYSANLNKVIEPMVLNVYEILWDECFRWNYVSSGVLCNANHKRASILRLPGQIAILVCEPELRTH